MNCFFLVWSTTVLHDFWELNSLKNTGFPFMSKSFTQMGLQKVVLNILSNISLFAELEKHLSSIKLARIKRLIFPLEGGFEQAPS